MKLFLFIMALGLAISAYSLRLAYVGAPIWEMWAAFFSGAVVSFSALFIAARG